jgi:serine/threonine-protein kinase
MEFEPGAVVAGKYRLEHIIGSGGSGEVWQAENLVLGAKVALKTLRDMSSQELTARFKREAHILARIRSDYVARVLDFVCDEIYGYVLVLDLIEGESLTETLKYKRLSIDESIGLGIDLLSGVSDLHQARIVHRDLKPSNIIEQVFADGTRRAVIVDFGVSRLVSAEGGREDEEVTSITRGAMRIGTIAYMAPEQLINSSAVGFAADIYAVGVILYRAVVGQTPFAGLSDLALASIKRLEEAPPIMTGRDDARAKGFEAIITRALKRRSAERYLTAEEMLEDLRSLRLLPGDEVYTGALPRPGFMSQPAFDFEVGPHDVAGISGERALDPLAAAEHPRFDPPSARTPMNSAIAIGPNGVRLPFLTPPSIDSARGVATTNPAPPHPPESTRESTLPRTAGIISAIVAALVVGLAVGRMTGPRPSATGDASDREKAANEVGAERAAEAPPAAPPSPATASARGAGTAVPCEVSPRASAASTEPQAAAAPIAPSSAPQLTVPSLASPPPFGQPRTWPPNPAAAGAPREGVPQPRTFPFRPAASPSAWPSPPAQTPSLPAKPKDDVYP